MLVPPRRLFPKSHNKGPDGSRLGITELLLACYAYITVDSKQWTLVGVPIVTSSNPVQNTTFISFFPLILFDNYIRNQPPPTLFNRDVQTNYNINLLTLIHVRTQTESSRRGLFQVMYKYVQTYCPTQHLPKFILGADLHQKK